MAPVPTPYRGPSARSHWERSRRRRRSATATGQAYRYAGPRPLGQYRSPDHPQQRGEEHPVPPGLWRSARGVATSPPQDRFGHESGEPSREVPPCHRGGRPTQTWGCPHHRRSAVRGRPRRPDHPRPTAARAVDGRHQPATERVSEPPPWLQWSAQNPHAAGSALDTSPSSG